MWEVLADVDEDDVAGGFEDLAVALGVPDVFLDGVALADVDDVGLGQRGAALAVDDDAVALVFELGDGVVGVACTGGGGGGGGGQSEDGGGQSGGCGGGDGGGGGG